MTTIQEESHKEFEKRRERYEGLESELCNEVTNRPRKFISLTTRRTVRREKRPKAATCIVNTLFV